MTRPESVQRRMIKFSRVGLAAVVALMVAFSSAPAQAAPRGVSEIVVADSHSTLRLSFHKPVTEAEAAKARQSLSSTPLVETLAASEFLVYCWGGVSMTDSNGVFSPQYYCGTPRTLPWGFRISPGVQSIIVGNVFETGLRWWRNGIAMPQNAPHTVPASYHFHGTMTPVYFGNGIDFQDYMTFRHNIGPGGTGSLSFAGSLVTMS